MMWDRIFTSPEDERWHLVSDGVNYGLNHDCDESGEHALVLNYHGCAYCGAKEPEALWGLYQLAVWDR